MLIRALAVCTGLTENKYETNLNKIRTNTNNYEEIQQIRINTNKGEIIEKT